MRRTTLVLAAGLALAGTACGSPFSDTNCSADRIVADFQGSFTLEGVSRELSREDAVAATNLPPDAFRQLNQVLLEGGAATTGVVWSHGGIGTANDFFALAVGPPLQEMEPRSAVGFQGGGWGPLDLGGSNAAFALRLDGSWAEAVEGQLTVLETVPAHIAVDVQFTLADGRTGSLSGSDAFFYDRGTCADARE